MAGREFQRDGAMKLKERWPNDLRFRFGIFSSFSLRLYQGDLIQQKSHAYRDGDMGVWRGGGEYIIYLSLHCYHQNDSCIKMGSDESHFNV